MRFIVPKILALAVSVRAAGIAVVLNNSPGPIYVWSVGGSVGPRHDIKAGQYQGGRWFQFQLTVTGGIYWEEMRRDDRSGGIAIKITRAADGLLSGAPQQVWAYNVDGATVWYDLSTVFGAPFAGSRLDVTGDNGGSIVWPSGVHPGGSQLTKAPSEGNIFFSINPVT
jgi:Na+/proline symporter